jgi:hypothetical protein
MNDIEQKALALLNEVRKGANPESEVTFVCRDLYDHEALCRAIERHEAFRQEVSDAVEQALSFGDVESLRRKGVLSRFIIPKPKPDPLAQTLGDFDGTLWEPEDVLRFRAALEARGLEIREKNDG